MDVVNNVLRHAQFVELAVSSPKLTLVTLKYITYSHKYIIWIPETYINTRWWFQHIFYLYFYMGKCSN